MDPMPESPANVWRSTDLGATWSRDAVGLPPAYPIQTFAYTNDGYLWASAATGVYKRKVELTSGVAAPDTRTLSVRPNPSRDRFTVQLPEAKYASLELRDLLGRTVRSERELSGRTSLVVDVAGLAPGRYWLVLKGVAGPDISAIVVE